MKKKFLLIILSLVVVGGVAVWKWDSIRWEMEKLRGAILDINAPTSNTLPTAVAASPEANQVAPPPTVQSSFEATAPAVSPTRISTPIPLITPPKYVELKGVKWEKQDINNCAAATLAMYLSFYGWKGTQKDVADVVKPIQRDKNVRWDELVFYVKTNAGWLEAMFGVGGDEALLKRFVANGFPIVIETGYEVVEGWVGHYLLITGYDDEQKVFIVQDATGGADRRASYKEIEQGWQQFNYLYVLVYPPSKQNVIVAVLGDDANEATNRKHALSVAERETKAQPDNAFAWFNLGSNLNYFDRYAEAAKAFDKAREIGLPKRMLFYQFGPYRAYFNVGRYKDVVDLTTFTIDYRPDVEETYFWRGWAQYQLGKKSLAVADFKSALEVNPTFDDAKVALGTVR
ncbi:MAG: C39 family peptidase [Chloroflexota bacterium]